jgi:hypothetical protein
VRERGDHAVVVSGDGEDRCGVRAVRLVKLVVVILRLPEAVDDVAEQQVEGWDLLVRRLVEVARHLVGDVVLRLRPFRAAAVAVGVKHDLAGLLDPGERDVRRVRRAHHLFERQARLGRLAVGARGGEGERGELVLLVEGVDLLVRGAVRRVVDAKRGRIGRGLRLREDRVTEVASSGRVGLRLSHVLPFVDGVVARASELRGAR